jgi:hypothetical protein
MHAQKENMIPISLLCFYPEVRALAAQRVEREKKILSEDLNISVTRGFRTVRQEKI